VGRHDNVAPVHFSEEIANGIPRAKLAIFEHSGHNPATDERKKFREVVFDFVKNEIL
jgi:proline iminopeptidase